jgi:large subunit ribosomal protein L29
MKKSLLREVRELPDADLLKQISETQGELYNKRVEAKTGQIENTAQIRKLKKNIARMITEANQRKRTPVA